MTSADEMLASVVEESYILVDLETRMMTIPSSITTLGVESDDDVLRLPFKMPRYIGDIDLSDFNVRINYLNARKQGDVFEPDDVVAGDDGYITFSWLVGRHAAAYKGNVSFIVCLKKYDEDGSTVLKEFNSTIAILPILEGLETYEAVVVAYADILEAWKVELFDIHDGIEADVDAYINSLPDAPVVSVNGATGIVNVETISLGGVTVKPFNYVDDTYNQMGVAFAKGDKLLGQLYFNIDEPNSPKLSFRDENGTTAYHTVYTNLNKPTEIVDAGVSISPFINANDAGYNNYGINSAYGDMILRWFIQDNRPTIPRVHVKDANGADYYHKLYSDLNKPSASDVGALSVNGGTVKQYINLTYDVTDESGTTTTYKTSIGVGSTGNSYIGHTVGSAQKNYLILNQDESKLAVPLGISSGGTGKSTADDGRKALGAASVTRVEFTLPGNWGKKSAVIAVSGVTASKYVMLVPKSDSYDHFMDCRVRASTWGTDTVTLVATTIPTSELVFDVLIIDSPQLVSVTPKNNQETE